MQTVLRELLGKIVLVFQLAIVVSLVGYPIANAGAALHEAGFAVQPVQSIVQDGHDHAHGEAAIAVDDDAAAAQSPEDCDRGENQRSDCCGDFCFGIDVAMTETDAGMLRRSSIRFRFDDSKALGHAPLLNRPPKI
ncbi:hypothetical protein HDIA_4280 [Hartmannibacter diazotrophicus]|uniref:Uncharacterized protein n=1 Tax=Hartmannibacter diazotrophicus TaxID=1482074 RepID=A0A2C9DDI9_9HYPH|nr:hypothetical protein [Hartmannibacter diazotrophicus]SON57821.1 hypothetical protein HDIA_4280 [Hartmannibacter diazotrophicus]